MCSRTMSPYDVPGRRTPSRIGTIEIEQFVPKTQIDDLYIRDPYYIAPDGEVGQQAFAVIREAIRKEGMVAVGKVVFTARPTLRSGARLSSCFTAKKPKLKKYDDDNTKESPGSSKTA
jgi:hypothetical protein